VRELAHSLDLAVAAKGDSQEICFVPNGDYAGFLEAYLRERGRSLPASGGAILNTAGKPLGTHPGVHHFTVGQRRGLGIAAGEPLYVIRTEPKSQKVVVGAETELFGSHLVARDANWVSVAPIREPTRAQVKIRNKHVAAPAWLEPLSGGRVEVRFDEPQRAITPGQAAVFYQDELVLGGGWIER
jgi:tRNA-uridine 2-sulfurtransferase